MGLISGILNTLRTNPGDKGPISDLTARGRTLLRLEELTPCKWVRDQLLLGGSLQRRNSLGGTEKNPNPPHGKKAPASPIPASISVPALTRRHLWKQRLAEMPGLRPGPGTVRHSGRRQLPEQPAGRAAGGRGGQAAAPPPREPRPPCPARGAPAGGSRPAASAPPRPASSELEGGRGGEEGIFSQHVLRNGSVSPCLHKPGCTTALAPRGSTAKAGSAARAGGQHEMERAGQGE